MTHLAAMNVDPRRVISVSALLIVNSALIWLKRVACLITVFLVNMP